MEPSQINLVLAWAGILVGFLSGLALDLFFHRDLVALSTFTAQLKEACDVADFCRARGIPLVMGGVTVSSLPDEARELCTSVVVGEGEPIWPEVLRDFESGRLKPLCAQSPPGWFSLLDAPIPRFDLLDPPKYNRLTDGTSAGPSRAAARRQEYRNQSANNSHHGGDGGPRASNGSWLVEVSPAKQQFRPRPRPRISSDFSRTRTRTRMRTRTIFSGACSNVSCPR